MKRYADRIFLSLNGQRVVDLQSCTVRQNHNARAVPTMTPDRYNRGHVRGNVDIDITAQIAIDNALARPKFENIDYGLSDVQITAVFGSDQLVMTGVFLKDNDDAAGGVGDEVKSTFNFGAIKITDAVGNSSLFDGSIFTSIA